MIKVKMVYPQFGGIGRVGDAYVKYLPEFGVRFVDKNPDLVVGHAGNLGANVHVEHNHGVYWTADMPRVYPNHWTGNSRVIQALRAARVVTVPSNWVRINIARNMHIDPVVIPHGVDFDEWRYRGRHEGYVLWNKARDKDVCDPRPVTQLAKKHRDVKFVTTFAKEQASNIKVLGRLPFELMKPIIQKAGVYLATTKETFGIGTLEAMACGVPVLGYDWGGTSDLVTHRENGYLVRPGDIDGLAEGLVYCNEHRKRLGDAARETARGYTWQRAVEMVAQAYRDALSPTDRPGVTIVIPSYGYAAVVGRAIQSCLDQTLPPKAIIVVDDGSPDQGATKRAVGAFTDPRVKYIRQPNAGVAHARNHGISLADTELICCLDADDQIAPTFLEKLVPAFSDPLVGVAYSSLLLIYPGGRTAQGGWPPQCNFDLQCQGKNQVPTCCVFRKRAWRESGGYRQRYAPQGCGTEDAAFWLSLGANGWKMKKVTNERLFLYTMGGRTWDKKNYIKTDWLSWHPFTRDKQHPFASIATPNPHPSHPVTQLDVPEVSVVIPVGPDHTTIITDALDSLEAQTFRKWEAIVVNDSGEELDMTPWPYATLVDTPGKKGAGYTRNRGTEAAKASEIVYLDADDFLQADALERFLAARKQYPNIWIYPDMYTHRANGDLEYYACSDFTAKELWRRGIAPVTCLYTKAMWKRVNGFDEESHREDWDFHLRLAKAGYCGIRIAEALLTYRHRTGTRRASGSIRKEAAILHERYNREELMARCGSCSKRAKLRKNPVSNLPPANWQTKDDAGWPLIEFTGGNTNDLVFRGKTGRRYIAGNNSAHRTLRVHPQDYQMLLRLRYFRAIEETESLMVAESEPKPPPPRKPKPKQVEQFDITNMTLKLLREADLTGQNLNLLIKTEEENKARSTVLRELRAAKRRRQRGNK